MGTCGAIKKSNGVGKIFIDIYNFRTEALLKITTG